MNNILEYIYKFIRLVHLTDLLDILIVAVALYKLIDWVKETRAMQLIKGIMIIFIILIVSDWTNLTMLHYILNSVIQVGVFAIFVIFQPEVRSFLEKLGRSKFAKVMDIATVVNENEITEQSLDEIIEAVENMAKTKTGALIVIERKTRLGDTINSGTKLDAYVSSHLLENIFVPNTPLHDGAVIIRGNRIISAGCFLPLTSNDNLSRELGTRHRAAIGISEASDALIVVVSEETGKISVAINGGLTRNLSGATLKRVFEKYMPESFNTQFKFWKNYQKNGGIDDAE